MNTFSAPHSRSWPGISWRSTSSWRWAELVPLQRTSLRKWCGWKRAIRDLSSWTCSVQQVRQSHRITTRNPHMRPNTAGLRHRKHKLQHEFIFLRWCRATVNTHIYICNPQSFCHYHTVIPSIPANTLLCVTLVHQKEIKPTELVFYWWLSAVYMLVVWCGFIPSHPQRGTGQYWRQHREAW